MPGAKEKRVRGYRLLLYLTGGKLDMLLGNADVKYDPVNEGEAMF